MSERKKKGGKTGRMKEEKSKDARWKRRSVIGLVDALLADGLIVQLEGGGRWS